MSISIPVLLSLLLITLLSLLIYYAINTQYDTSKTQRDISDAALIELFVAQPDGLLSPHRLAKLTGLTLNQARHRLQAFSNIGITRSNYNRRGRKFYQLAGPLAAAPDVQFSADPFLTMEDLNSLFEVYQGRVGIAEMILATRLPLKVLLEEMTHFENEKIIDRLTETTTTQGTPAKKFYVLREPYRSDPSLLSGRASEVDLQLKELLRNEDLYV